MNWNYRLIDLSHLNGNEPWVTVHEVYYKDDGSLIGYAEASLGSEDVAGMRTVLERMALALDKPVLKVSDFKGHEPTKSDVLTEYAQANDLPITEVKLADAGTQPEY